MYCIAGSAVSFLPFRPSVLSGGIAYNMQYWYMFPPHTIEIIASAMYKVKNWQDIVMYL